MPEITQFPHCDQRILHAKGECEYCDRHPEWQELRRAWGIAFTGRQPKGSLPQCGAGREERIGLMTVPARERLDFICQLAAGHEGDHLPIPELEQLPCPADAARPPGSDADPRQWPGNRPEGYGAPVN